MATDTEKDTEEQPEADPLEVLESRAKSQMNLIFAAGITSMLFLGSLGFTYVSLNTRVLSGTQEPLIEMTKLANDVSDDYTNLNLAVEFNNHQIDSITRRLEAVQPSIDQSKFLQLEQVMVGQERDYQHFLSTVKTAVHGLSEMVTGSRGWRNDFNDKLDAAVSTSLERMHSLNGEAAASQASSP